MSGKRYSMGGGLYLQVYGRSRSWLFRYKRRGRTRWMGLGSLELVSLPEARRQALDARKLLAAGADPIEFRKVTDTSLRALVKLLVDEAKAAKAAA